MDAAATSCLPLPQPLSSQIVSWAAFHGWDAADPECQRLLVRQAMLNALIRQVVPGAAERAFATPLDSLGVQAPQALAEAVAASLNPADSLNPNELTLRPHAAGGNPWGELYDALIPQARRRRIGQFWTAPHIADWMAAWLLRARPHRLVDVGCGAGNFLLAAARRQNDHSTCLCGCDVSPLLLNLVYAAFQTQTGGSMPPPTLTVQDYLADALPPDADAVICNPPYTRHHHISPELKDALQAFLKARLGLDVSRQGTLAFYFLLKLIAEMPPETRAAVIVPMEVLDARYGQAARRVLAQHTALSALIYFAPQMNAFRNVDVGASILLFRKGYERANPVRCLTLAGLPDTEELLACLEPASPANQELPFGSLIVQSQDDLLERPKWFSIATPQPLEDGWERNGLVTPLKTLAKVVRGIATGANDFFALSTEQVERRGLEQYVVRTLHRNREVQDIVLDEAGWQSLAEAGKRVWLLYLNGQTDMSPALHNYLAEGETNGYHRRGLVQTRKRWYWMEQRDVPPIFFTILTRGNPRFILNRAAVRPLNMFSLIYPNPYVCQADAVDVLWVLLNSNFSLSRLHSVSRTYGGNTLKVEPRELDNLPVINPLALPDDVTRKIKGWIADFYQHRQAATLLAQVNALVESLLAQEVIRTRPSRLPVQLRLLERP